jgi:hypothetical protein
MRRRRRRGSDALQILNSGAWCVVSDPTNRVISWMRFEPGQDWRLIFADILKSADEAGWELEEHRLEMSTFFCRHQRLRVLVSLQPTPPRNPLPEWPLPPPAHSIRDCLKCPPSNSGTTSKAQGQAPMTRH